MLGHIDVTMCGRRIGGGVVVEELIDDEAEWPTSEEEDNGGHGHVSPPAPYHHHSWQPTSQMTTRPLSLTPIICCMLSDRASMHTYSSPDILITRRQ